MSPVPNVRIVASPGHGTENVDHAAIDRLKQTSRGTSHDVSDIGLHYAYPDEWGFSPDSTIVQGMRDAVDNGYYVISQYSDIDDLQTRERVLVQEFAYWVITTAWDLQEDYGPREVEWQVTDRDDLRAKLPEMDALMVRTVDRIMVAPSRATLEEIGPTRAEESD